jgi:hypothetical protein
MQTTGGTMHWLPHDLGLWGFILAIAAIVLAIPFGVVSALLTPKFQVWRATRSMKSTAQKLVKLVQYRDELREIQLLTIPELVMIEQQLRTTFSIYFVGFLLMAFLSTNPASYIETVGIRTGFTHYRQFGAFMFTYFVGGGGYAYAVLRTKSYLQRASPIERAKLEEEIESVRQKLSALSKAKAE